MKRNNIRSVGIVGFGNFGSLLFEILRQSDIIVRVFSRKHKPDNLTFFPLKDVLACDLVIPAVPIHAFASVITKISQQLPAETIVMDVCSVKRYPVEIMKKILPKRTTIIASHPLFGPLSVGKHHGDTSRLRIVMSLVCADNSEFDLVKKLFQDLGFEIVIMQPDAHDRAVAKSQFISHLIALIAKKVFTDDAPIDTRSTLLLKDFLKKVNTDQQLFCDIFRYNPYCKKQLQKFAEAFAEVKNYLPA